MTTLYSDALAAFQSSQSGREGEARQALAAVLSPYVADSMTVADLEVAETHTRFVFTDGYVHIAVILRGETSEVALVTGAVGDWTNRGTFASLAELGALLPTVLPPPGSEPDPEPVIPQWAPGVVYEVGDHVMYRGVEYVCAQRHGPAAANWTPDVVSALWAVVV